MEGYTATIDCDVIQADGGTRTASITGAALALYIALEKYVRNEAFQEHPMKELVAAISVGIYEGNIVVDLDYSLDSEADVDMNVVMTESGKYVEVQGTGEEASFSKEQLSDMLNEAEKAIKNLIVKQREVVNGYVYSKE
jgi:ribonuclease PH